jgi:hypothetical protein
VERLESDFWKGQKRVGEGEKRALWRQGGLLEKIFLEYYVVVFQWKNFLKQGF